MNFTKNSKNGFIAPLTMFLLVIFGLIGIAYWYSSRMNTDMLFVEAHRIKARNFAQAGIETAKIEIVNRSRTKLYDKLSELKSKNFEKEFEDGGFRVVSIKPYELESVKYQKVPHIVKGRLVGDYDIWEVVAEGYSKQTKVTASIKTLIKVYRNSVVY